MHFCDVSDKFYLSFYLCNIRTVYHMLFVAINIHFSAMYILSFGIFLRSILSLELVTFIPNMSFVPQSIRPMYSVLNL